MNADVASPLSTRAQLVLDSPEQWRRFSQPKSVPQGSQDLWESYISIAGLSCSACAAKVQTILRRTPGVQSAEVNAASRSAQVIWDATQTKPSLWLTALSAGGYPALPVDDVNHHTEAKRQGRLALWRWLVAGFCMMQVMMYASPAYFAGPGEIDAQLLRLMSWASWVLCLPVLVFSCGPMFANAWRDLLARRVGMDTTIVLGLLVAFIASTASSVNPNGILGDVVWFDSITMFVFFLLSARLLEQRLRARSSGAIEALTARLPASVERRSAGGVWQRTPIQALVIGDYIRVAPGEAFAADGQLVDGETLVDEALLSGESRALRRRVGDSVIAGSFNLSAVVQVQVQRLGEATQYAQIVQLMRRAATQRPRMVQLADRIAGPFLLAVLLAAVLGALWWWPSDPARAVAVAVAVLIVTCPCALSLATPAALLATMGALAREGILLREPQALETLNEIDTVVFDKTGTLTDPGMVLGHVVTAPQLTRAEALTLAAALAQHSLHPVARSLADAATQAQAPSQQSQVVLGPVSELAGQGLSAQLRQRFVGLEQTTLRLGSVAFVQCTLPPLAAESRWVHLADENRWLASFELHERLRADAVQAVQALRQRGLAIELLSGDQTAAVARVAAALGIHQYRAQQSPQDKLAALEYLQQHLGRRVLMVGDGINDAPALAQAQLCATVGLAAPLAQQRADVVCLGPALMVLPALFDSAARTQRVLRQNLAWAACYNLIAVPFAVLGLMPPWLAGLGMALSSLVVVANATRLSRKQRGGPHGDFVPVNSTVSGAGTADFGGTGVGGVARPV